MKRKQSEDDSSHAPLLDDDEQQYSKKLKENVSDDEFSQPTYIVLDDNTNHTIKIVENDQVLLIDNTNNNNHHHNNQQVKLILSDELKEISGLREQLSGNKIKISTIQFQTIDTLSISNFNKYNYITNDIEGIEYITTCPSKHLIILITTDYKCYTYHLQSKTFSFKFNLPVKFDSVHVDSQFENIYFEERQYITKYKILNEFSIGYSEIWEIKWKDSKYVTCYCEERNELYIKGMEENVIHVYDLENGQEKREIVKPLNDLYTEKLYYDESEDVFYSLCYDYVYTLYRGSSTNSAVQLESESSCKLLAKFNENISKLVFYENYIMIFTVKSNIYIYDKKTTLSNSFSVGDFSTVNHFRNNLFYYINDTDIKIVKLIIRYSNIENVPIQRDSYQYLSKLGAEFKTQFLIDHQKSKLLEFLFGINFRKTREEKLFFIENSFNVNLFKFTDIVQIDEPIDDDDLDDCLIIGVCHHERIKDLQEFHIYIMKSELENSNNYDDFQVYYYDSVNDKICLPFSEFIRKLSFFETVQDSSSRMFLYNFEKIYQELIQLSIIDSQTKAIDNNTLLEEYKKIMFEIDDYIALVRKFNQSQVIINDISYLKMDLIVLARSFCSEMSFLKYEPKTNSE